MQGDANDLLRRSVSPAFWAACTVHIEEASSNNNNNTQHDRRARLLFQQLLQADLNQCGAATLPPGVQALHDTTLRGKFLLQADEVLNIGAAVRERYSGQDGAARCLKLLLTDGAQQVAALEYRHTPALHSAMPAGTKLLVWDPPVRRGMLLLTPQNCSVLGGSVAALEAARQRMVAHWTQPAVGRRGPPPSMAQAAAAATQAAWADGLLPGGGPQRPQQHQIVQGPEARPQHSQQQQQQQQQRTRPSQQPTQIMTQQQHRQHQQQQHRQHQQQQPLPQSGMPQQGPSRAGFGPAGPALQQAPPQEQAGGTGGGGRLVPVAPLQEHNGAASGGQHKRSRLALPKPGRQQEPPAAQRHAPVPAGAADFSFAQPQQQQQQQQGAGQLPHAAPPLQARVQPQLLQRLRQTATRVSGGAAANGLGAGTDDDPICLDGEEQLLGEAPHRVQEPGRSVGGGPPGDCTAAEGAPRAQAAPAGDVEMADAQQLADDDGWGDDDGWAEEPPAVAGLDPWEEGYDEEQLPDVGMQAGAYNDSVGLEGGGGSLDDGGLEKGRGDGREEQMCQAGHERVECARAVGAPEAHAAGGSDDGWEEEEEEDARQQHQQQQPLTKQHCVGPGSGTRHSSGSAGCQAGCRNSGQAAEQAQAAPAAERSAQHSGGRREWQQRQDQQEQPTAQLLPAGDVASTTTTVGVQVLPAQRLAAPAQPSPAGDSRQLQRGPWLPSSGMGMPAAPALEPLDPALLDAAPTLAEVLYAKQLAAPPAPAAAGPSSGKAAPGAPFGRPSASARGPQRLQPAAPPLPTIAARLPTGAEPAAGGIAAAVEDSDDDMPSFGLLDDLSPDRQPAQHAPAGSREEPFTYLVHLAAKASAADAACFPLTARILATVKTFVGKLQFKDPLAGQPQYGMEMLVEDGSLVARAVLSHRFIADFFGMEPPEFEACIADPVRRGEAASLAKGLQTVLATYSGLMQVKLAAAGQQLEVTDLLMGLSAEQGDAFQRRATSATGV